MADPEVSPHREYDRFMGRQRRWGERWRRVGQLMFYVIAALLALTFAAIVVIGVIDLSQPRVWGTFTQTDCEPRVRGGCRPVGTWVSDDGSLTKRGVYLDGWVTGDGKMRASYQPTAIISDETNNIVHIQLLSGAGPWLAAAFLFGWVSYVLFKAASWGDIRLPLPGRLIGVRSRRRGRPEATESPRRRYRESLDSANPSDPGS